MNLPQPHALHTALLEHPDALLVVRKPSAPPKPAPGQPGTGLGGADGLSLIHI